MRSAMTRRLLGTLCLLLLSAAALAAQQKGNPAAPAPKVDMTRWRLQLAGAALESPVALGYEDLLQLPEIKKRAYLVCPGLFGYSADWEGVPLAALLERGKAAGTWTKVTFIALDGYEVTLTRDQAEANTLFIALKVYGKPLPPAEGFPARLVADGLTGGKWVRWLKEIRVD
jgi:DMSO/TMAO reductase YedYZ molybdopterin-dependent catalytic subunit